MILVFVTLWLAFTGFIWTIELWKNGDYRLALQPRKCGLTIIDSTSKNIGKFKLPGHQNILDGLVDCYIAIPSSCEGSGTCVLFKTELDKNVKITSTDKHHFSESKIEEGKRLACQYQCDEALSVFNYICKRKMDININVEQILKSFY